MAKRTEILVVDDEKDMCDALSDALMSEGYKVETSLSGEDALEKLNKGAFNIVIADIKMPGIDGLELLRRVKKTSPEIDVILITGYESMETAISAVKHGASDYITKPFDMDEIYVVIKRSIERQKRIWEDKKLLKRYQQDAQMLKAEKKRLEEELRLADKMAALGRMAAGIAHEINNPLGIIKGNAQYLLGFLEKSIFKVAKAEDIKGCRETLESVAKETERCAKIISDLLHLSRKEEMAIAPTDVNKGLEEVLTLVRHTSSSKKNKDKSKLRSSFATDNGGLQLSQAGLLEYNHQCPGSHARWWRALR